MHQPLRNEEEGDGYVQYQPILNNVRNKLYCFRCCTRTTCLSFFEKKRVKFIVLLLLSIFTFFSFRYGWSSSPCWEREDELEFLVPNTDPWPLRNAHSHNDYQQIQPLREALMAGFCSMEGDVFLRKGILYLGHMFNVIGTITLEDTYLKPLIKLIQENEGFVYKRSTRLGTCLQVTLLVDIKSVETNIETWKLLEDMLSRLDVGLSDGRPIFETYFEENNKRKFLFPSPIRVVVTGISGTYLEIVNLMKVKNIRKTWIDLPIETDYMDAISVAKWISTKWHFPWPDKSSNLENTKNQIKQRVAFARKYGLSVRYWDTPEDADLWTLLLELDVDLINTDRIYTLHTFLVGRNFDQS